jgi:hypothetical protein
MRITRAQRESRRIDRRRLQLKIRVLAPKGTPKDVVIDTMLAAAERGILPKGYQIRWIDWEKGEEGTANAGKLSTHLAQELHGFFLALSDPKTRLKVKAVED